MVTITKTSAGKKKRTTLLCKTASAILLLLLLWFGIASVARTPDRAGAGASPSNGPLRRPPPQTDNIDRASGRLAALSRLVPLSQADAVEARFLLAMRRECLPGRDDAAGEINPTTRRQRECLRHVPLGRMIDGAADEMARRIKQQRPRIGILVPPGFVARGLAGLAARALSATAVDGDHPVQILVTSRVPVYGYGKSHGFTKLVRLAALPAALAAYDAALWGASASPPLEEALGGSDLNALAPDSSVLRDALQGIDSGTASALSADTIGMALMLIMRWHCRLSHVSAHTAMITLSLEDVIKDPVNVLARMLQFVWKEDWEWEGHGEEAHPPIRPGPVRSWTREAQALVGNRPGGDGAESWQTLLAQTSLVARATTMAVQADASFAKAVQGAFASEMQRSKDMSAWPCPSFWEGVDTDGGSGGSGWDTARALQRLAAEMVPACRDDDPFVRCTVNKDRCEVRRDAACR